MQAHDAIDFNTLAHTSGREQHYLHPVLSTVQQLAPSYAESSGVSAAATDLESEALKVPTGVTSDKNGPSIAEYAAAAASGAPASAACASTTASDTSLAATGKSATAADEFTAAAVGCKSTTMDKRCSYLVASSSSMPERLGVTPGSHGQLSSISTFSGTSSRLATALMSDL